MRTMLRWSGFAMALLGLAACSANPDAEIAQVQTDRPASGTTPAARFAWFEYRGEDPVFASPLPEPDAYRNPILAGFYPDPSLTQVDGTFYLVHSTFAWYPGIPVFRSRDLVSWTQIGNVIDRPGMLDFAGLGMSRGVFAPTIEHHEGRFYVANTCVDCGGNFIVTATDPAGPWSDPVWLPQVGGIDPSLFFDVDGRVYLMNNDAPPGEPRYDGHRAIWIREIDPRTFQSVSEPVVLIDGGVRPEEKPIWIEGPHIYRIGDHYYLSAAEGGTAEGHSQVVLRASQVLGPYVPNPDNPILTQRHLPRDRPDPITSVGHADFVRTANGEWWVTFLGVRPYGDDLYNTGRETFLMPVRWKDGWPVITQGAEAVPWTHPRPDLPAEGAPAIPTTGNFALREEFELGPLGPHWIGMRVPPRPFHTIEHGELVLQAGTAHMSGKGQPSLIGRRQQHTHAQVSTELRFAPRREGDVAGLVALQNDDHHYFLALGRDGTRRVVQVRRRAGADDPPDGVLLASAELGGDDAAPVRLRIDARGGSYDFLYGEAPGEWRPLLQDADGTVLSTRVAGGFVGVVFGLYAHAPR